MKKWNIIVVGVFLVAFLIRALLINWTLQYGNNGDLTRYEDWARVVHAYGFADAYTPKHVTTVAVNEPPGTLYVESAAFEIYILEGRLIARITHTSAGSLLWVNTYLQHATMKVPLLMTDMLMGVVVYLLVKKLTDKKKALIAASLFLFNPIVIYNSAIWGQMDSINNFFFILALFFAFRKNTILSLLAYTLSLYIKLSLLPLLPFYLVFLYFVSGKNTKRLMTGVIISLFLFVAATFPISHNPLVWLIQNLPPLSQGELQNVTNSAFNFWMGLTCMPFFCNGTNIPVVTQTFLGVSLNIWGYMLFAAFTLPFLFWQIKKSQQFLQPKYIFFLFSFIALCIFLFLPKMHDRYMYPVFPLFAMALVFVKKWKAYVSIFCLLTLFHFDNIMYSWFPIVFNSATTFYHVFYGPYLRWIISIATVIVSMWLYVLILINTREGVTYEKLVSKSHKRK